MVKNKIAGTATLATVVAAVVVVRRVGPILAERGMKKCHEMMARHLSQAGPAEQAVQSTVRTEAGRESAGLAADQPQRAATTV